MQMGWERIARALIALVGVVACVALSQPPPRADSRVTLEVVPNSTVLRILARSQLDFVADLFWVRMGNMAARASNAHEGAALLPLGNLIADLAPGFKYPYFLGGVIAPWRRGRSKHYDNAAEALALMSRGLEQVTWGRLYLQKAFTELEMLHDHVAAGKTLTEFSREPEAPAYIGPLAARLLAQGGDFEGARELARSMASSDDPQVRADGEARLREIDLEQLLAALDQVVERFTALEGRPPTSLEELVRRGLLRGIPADPGGGTIELTPDGARSTTSRTRLRQFVPME